MCYTLIAGSFTRLKRGIQPLNRLLQSPAFICFFVYLFKTTSPLKFARDVGVVDVDLK